MQLECPAPLVWNQVKHITIINIQMSYVSSVEEVQGLPFSFKLYKFK